MTGTWSKVVKQIEYDLGGPILPHTPPPRPARYDCGMVPVFHDDPAATTPAVEQLLGALPAHREIHVSNADGSEPPTPAETLALADELTAAGTPDEAFVGDAIREALQAAADDIAREAVNTVPQLTFARPAVLATFAAMCASIRGAIDRDRAAGLPPRIKLTAEQIATVPRISPEHQRFRPGATMFGYPVDLVDTVEESTPYVQGLLEQPRLIKLTPTDMAPAEVAEFRAVFEQAYCGEGPRVDYRQALQDAQRAIQQHVYCADSPSFTEALRTAESVARPSKVNVPPDELDDDVPPTVGFHEPPQPCWLVRAIRRIFG